MDIMQIAFYGKTDVGLKRKKNEDAFVVSPDRLFCLVADGMGGASAGELASDIFAKATLDVFSERTDTVEEETVRMVQKAFTFANDRILDHVKKVPEHQGMGCTAELVVFTESGFIVGHVGDSRVYRFRKGNLEQLTTDHSLVQEQVNQGLITPEEAKKHSMRNIILRAVGIKKVLPLDLMKGRALSGDLFLLCSDGLTDLVDDEIISEIFSKEGSLPEKTDQLIELAKEAGGKDNITVALAEVI
jgi:serine/threonine protein phosphatase PrpC